MTFKNVVSLATGLALLCAGAARAAVVDLRFFDRPGEPVIVQKNTGTSGWFPWQLDMSNAAMGGDYDFHFQYDTEGGGLNHGLTLVSGRVGGYTDFAGWQPEFQFTPGKKLQVSIKRQEVFGCCNYYFAQVFFLLADNDGDIPMTLPQTLDFAALDVSSYEFRIQKVGPLYRNVGGDGGGMLQASPTGPGGPPVGGIPEPSTWAMMILGFGAAGAAMRRRKGAVQPA